MDIDLSLELDAEEGGERLTEDRSGVQAGDHQDDQERSGGPEEAEGAVMTASGEEQERKEEEEKEEDEHDGKENGSVDLSSRDSMKTEEVNCLRINTSLSH